MGGDRLDLVCLRGHPLRLSAAEPAGLKINGQLLGVLMDERYNKWRVLSYEGGFGLGIARFVKPNIVQFTLGSLAKLAEAFLELYLPILMARIIDVGIPTADRALILRTGGELLLFTLIGFFCAAVCQYFASLTSQATGTRIRDALIAQVTAFTYRELDRFPASTLINRMTSDVNNVQQAVAMTIRLVTRAPFILIGAVVLSFSVNRQLAMVFLMLTPLLALILFIILRLTYPLHKRAQSVLDGFARVVRENLTGVRVIRAFARTGEERARARQAARELSAAQETVLNRAALMQPATSVVLNAGVILLLFFGARQVFAGRVAQGDLLALTTYATKILYALIVIANLAGLFTKAAASSSRIQEVLAVRPSLRFPDAPGAMRADADAVSFSDVTFAYEDGEPALADISFALKPGETLGIVGVTGSGKSTILHLIARFYDVTAGRVSLFGADVRDFMQTQLRGLVAVVPQQTALFSGSIADNLLMGKPDATEGELIEALRAAQCLEFVESLPLGLESPVFEGGKNFSGGQRQRLAIARALVCRPRLLLLDDSLSALDYRTDLHLRRALKANYADTSIVIVSQRISSVRSANQILVLERGRMAGLGSHEALLEHCEVYHQIDQSQREEV